MLFRSCNFYTGIKVTLSAVKNLLDEALPQEDIDVINLIFPKVLKMDIPDRKVICSNIEKRFEALKKNYDDLNNKIFNERKVLNLNKILLKILHPLQRALSLIPCIAL